MEALNNGGVDNLWKAIGDLGVVSTQSTRDFNQKIREIEISSKAVSEGR